MNLCDLDPFCEVLPQSNLIKLVKIPFDTPEGIFLKNVLKTYDLFYKEKDAQYPNMTIVSTLDYGIKVYVGRKGTKSVF